MVSLDNEQYEESVTKEDWELEYKELQIIKHSLQRYVNRSEATNNEVETEHRLLEKVIGQIEILREKYGISEVLSGRHIMPRKDSR